jgi:adenine-specific DNA methylase
MVKIAYHQGETFDKSYFVATDGKEVKVISAVRVIPADVQKAITAAEATGEEAKDILSPEEAAAEIAKASNGTMEGFVEFSKSLPKLTREADLKREAEWAINEGEITKVEMPKKGEVIMSVKEDEKEDTDLPSGKSSKVKSYYGRLPSQAVGGQEQAINQQSSVNDKYNLLRQAFEEEKAKTEKLSKEKESMGQELGKLKEEKSVGQKKGSVSSILGALKKLGPLDPETEKTAVDMLVKVDEKALAVILDVLKLVGGEGGEGKDGPDMFGAAPKLNAPKAPKAPGMPPIPGMPQKASINGINLPQIGASSETISLIDKVSKMMDH